MKVRYKSTDEIRLMRDTNMVLSAILDDICAAVAPGVSTWELNEIAAAGIAKHKVESAFLGYLDYPAVLCTSINEVIVHGIPRKDVVLTDGDIIGIDFGIFKHGYCGDSCRTVLCGEVSEENKQLVDVTRKALQLGIEQCYPGNRLGDIGAAIQDYVEPFGYSVVTDFVGHGIGREMHENPKVPNYGERNKGKRLKSGLVIAIEPMVNAGTHKVRIREDKWTAVTKDGSMSAHFEHSIAITDEGPWVLSRESSLAPGTIGVD